MANAPLEWDGTGYKAKTYSNSGSQNSPDTRSPSFADAGNDFAPSGSGTGGQNQPDSGYPGVGSAMFASLNPGQIWRPNGNVVQPTSFEGYNKYAETHNKGVGGFFDQYAGMIGGFNQGGGGGGGYDPGMFDFSRQGVGFSNAYLEKQKQQLDYEKELADKDPFGQASINIRNKELELQLQQEKQKINETFAAQGAVGTPQHAKALRDAETKSMSRRDSIIQSMKEASGQYKLSVAEQGSLTMQRIGQLDTALSDINARINISEGQAKVELQKQKIAASSARAAARVALKLGILDRAIISERDQYGRWEGGRQFDADNFWKGQQFSRGIYEWDSEFDYTRWYNNEMMSLQKDLNKQSIWDTIGNLASTALNVFGVRKPNSNAGNNAGNGASPMQLPSFSMGQFNLNLNSQYGGGGTTPSFAPYGTHGEKENG